MVIHLPKESSIWLDSLFELLTIEIYQPDPKLGICYSLFQAGLQKIFTSAKELNKNMNRSAEITFNFKELVYKNYLEHKSVIFMQMLYLFPKNYLHRCNKRNYWRGQKNGLIKLIYCKASCFCKTWQRVSPKLLSSLIMGIPVILDVFLKR